MNNNKLICSKCNYKVSAIIKNYDPFIIDASYFKLCITNSGKNVTMFCRNCYDKTIAHTEQNRRIDVPNDDAMNRVLDGHFEGGK